MAWTWNVENYELMQMEKKRVWGQNNPRYSGGNKVYSVERELTIEEKLEVIDSLFNGVGTLMLDFIYNWNKNEESIKKTPNGAFHISSYRAMFKKLSPQEKLEEKKLDHIASIHQSGEYWFFGELFKNFSLATPASQTGYQMEHHGLHIVNQWFHAMLNRLLDMERKHFGANNSLYLKIVQITSLVHQHGYMEHEILQTIYQQNFSLIAEEILTGRIKEGHLDDIIAAYGEVAELKKRWESHFKRS